MRKLRSVHVFQLRGAVEAVAGLLVVLETTEARPVIGAIVGKSLNSSHLPT